MVVSSVISVNEILLEVLQELNHTQQLAGVKGHDIDICTKVPDDVQAEACLAIGGHSKKLNYPKFKQRGTEQKNVNFNIQ